jgi:hypothetical protein
MATFTTQLSRPLVALLLAVAPLAAREPSPNLRFGMPSPAAADPEQRVDYLIERPQYALSYNAKTGAAVRGQGLQGRGGGREGGLHRRSDEGRPVGRAPDFGGGDVGGARGPSQPSVGLFS